VGRAAIAVTQLARSDGILLFAPLVVAHLVGRGRQRAPGRRAAAAALGAGGAAVLCLVMSRVDLQLTEPPQSDAGRLPAAVYMRSYEEWYSLPESITREHWLADGWGRSGTEQRSGSTT